MADAAVTSWTATRILWSLAVFVLAGLFEISGGWSIWRGLRDKQAPQWFWSLSGAIALVIYGFVPLLQPESPSDQFGRIFAVYGCIFIAMAYAWAAAFDGLLLDAGDYIGASMAIAGGLIAFFWPR
jgi:small multidrug resistance family-3 protein